MKIHNFDTRQAAVDYLADEAAEILRATIATRGEALLLATGGVTPIPLYQALSTRELAWDKVTVLPSDARWLPEEQDGSNDGMIRRSLIQGPAAKARLLPLYGPEPTTEEALPRIRGLIASLPRPDLALLGMGEDGHTAAFFKGAEAFDAAVDPDNPETLMSIYAPSGAMTPHRLTMTLSALLRTRVMRIMFFGAEKRALFDAALEPGPVEALPIRTLIHQDRVPVETIWAP